MTSRYAFGDSTQALARLELLAELFAPEFEALLAAVDPIATRRGTALDLGCGIGATTRAVAEVLRPRETLGIDISEAMLDRARGLTSDASISYVRADVTARELPRAPAALITARLLLAHLPEPADAVRGWLDQLIAGGLLVIDEVERIAPGAAVIERYLSVTEALLAGGGTDLYVGAGLKTDPPAAHCELDRRFELPLDNAAVARMFRMNLEVWRADALAAKVASAAALSAIAEELDRLAATGGGRTTWTMRHIVLRSTVRQS
jgi:SAM-dependent methyltransferase